ncbi:hypothetical protein F383_20033 [Gossypium arboreum]|uniref:Uncharacterized protein n=1 Tax=Gossypium arboreum TaxID=29729 RepID=A0A0B0NL60_GOSAR|nr:hypothetical protein F383_20033 [Gossypium arboreum]
MLFELSVYPYFFEWFKQAFREMNDFVKCIFGSGTFELYIMLRMKGQYMYL